MKPADERSNEDLLMDLACERIRQLESDVENERKLKAEVLCRVAALESEVAKLRRGTFDAKGYQADLEKAYAERTSAPRLPDVSDYFVGLGK